VNLAEHYRQQADKLSGELLAKGKADDRTAKTEGKN
jgi:hypothetical protein